MGTIAEAAAEKIGANTLLARVGAYYHDIGKLISPQNFVENQLSEDNIHEDVAPEESVEMIKKHIEEGIKLGKKYNLPARGYRFYTNASWNYGNEIFLRKSKRKIPR